MRRVAHRGDDLVHLGARQLPAFAGLGPLDDLDLQLVGVGQVVDGHPEAAGGHLLDRGAAGVAVRLGDPAPWVLAPLARVRLAAHAVHGDGEGLVGLGGDGAVAHGAGREAADDLLLGLDLLQGHGRAGHAGAELQQAAQRRLAGRDLVRVLREAPVGVLAARARGHLQVGHGDRVPHVAVAAPAPVELAGIGQHRDADLLAARVAELVPTLHLLGEDREARTLDAARGPGEAAVHDLVGEAHGLEDLRALVGLQRGDPHLRHDLQDPLRGPLPVRGHDVVVAVDVLGVLEQSVGPGLPERLEGEVGVDRVGAVADEQAEVVHLPGLAGLHHDADARALVAAHEMVVHGAGREQGTDGHPVRTHTAVGEHDDARALGDGGTGLVADAVEGLAEPVGPVALREGRVDDARAPAPVVQVLQRRELLVREHGMRHPQAVGVLGSRLEEVPLGADVALQAHDHLLADRVDRGVRDLGEELLEVVVEHARLVREDRQRRVVAHGAERIAQLAHEGQEHELHGLDRVAEGLHARQEAFGVEAVRLLVRLEFRQVDALRLEPLPEGLGPREVALDLRVGDHAPLLEVDQEHAAGLEPALLDDALGIDGHHAHLRGHDALVVVGDVVARRPQAVAVEHGADVLAVREGNGRGTVPGLHEAGEVLVEGALLRLHGRMGLPGLRDHHQDRFLERPPGHEHELEHVVEVARIRAVRLDDREQPVDVVPEELAGDHALAGVHPVDVAPARVDLPVVAHEPVRLSAVPGGEGVRGEARVHHRQVGLVARIVQVRVKGEDLLGREHPLVDDHLRGERAHVEEPALGELRLGAHEMGDVLADQVELALEVVAPDAVAGAHDHHLHVGHGGAGGLAEVGAVRVHGHLAPADEALALGGDALVEEFLRAQALVLLARQEDDAGPVAAGLGELGAEVRGDGLAEEAVREPREDARAVAGVLLVALASAMDHAAVHALRVLDDAVARPSLDVADEADAAAVLLGARVVHALALGESEPELLGQAAVHELLRRVWLAAVARRPIGAASAVVGAGVREGRARQAAGPTVQRMTTAGPADEGPAPSCDTPADAVDERRPARGGVASAVDPRGAVTSGPLPDLPRPAPPGATPGSAWPRLDPSSGRARARPSVGRLANVAPRPWKST